MGRAKSQLVIRSITTPGNYDYINNFVLDEDGTISVQMDFGGYMLASYARDAASNNEEYPMFGVPVGPHTNGVLHDHVVGYKVDLDIAGTSNSFQTTSIKYGTYEEATGKTKPAYISYNGIKYAENIIHPTELGVHAKDYDGSSAIHTAAEGGRTAALRMLMDKGGADVCLTTPYGETALHLAAREGS